MPAPLSGNVVTREVEITGFDALDISDAFRVEINQGDGFRVVVRVDERLLEHLDVAKQGNALRIGLKQRRLRSIRDTTCEATVTMPELAGVRLSGASHATLRGFRSAKPLSANLSGASRMSGSIECGEVRFQVSGASRMTPTGAGGDATIDASGASTVDLTDFPVGDARVETSGASKVMVNARGSLDVVASGSSHVYALGDPTLRSVSTSGASSIRRK